MILLIVTEYNNNEPSNAILEILAEVHADLGEVYKHIWSKAVDFKNRSWTLRLMQWTFLCQKTAPSDKASLTMVSNDYSIHIGQNSFGKPKYIVESVEGMKRQIIGLSEDLVEPSNVFITERLLNGITGQFIPSQRTSFCSKTDSSFFILPFTISLRRALDYYRHHVLILLSILLLN